MHSIPQGDMDILRSLGGEIAEAARDPVNETRREIHRRIENMEHARPSIAIYQEPWHEPGVYYTYDSVDRLTREYVDASVARWADAPWGLAPWGAETAYFDYAYDAAGNRERSARGGVFGSVYCTYFSYDPTYYEYAADDSLTKLWRADTGAGAYFEYDATGSCEKIVDANGATYFEYTAANRVSRLVVPGGSDYLFGYDGSQKRHAIVEDGTATYFLWDGLDLVETRNADYSLKARFTNVAPPASGMIDGIGTCVEVHRASDSKRFYLLMDHRGTAHTVLDESKSVIATRLYNAFGETVSETGTWPDEVPFGYQSNWLALDGMTLPDGTRLYLSPTRVYDPGIGRFLQRDLIHISGDNRFEYGRSNPANSVDPWGLDPSSLTVGGDKITLPEGLTLTPGSDLKWKWAELTGNETVSDVSRINLNTKTVYLDPRLKDDYDRLVNTIVHEDVGAYVYRITGVADMSVHGAEPTQAFSNLAQLTGGYSALGHLTEYDKKGTVFGTATFRAAQEFAKKCQQKDATVRDTQHYASLRLAVSTLGLSWNYVKCWFKYDCDCDFELSGSFKCEAWTWRGAGRGEPPWAPPAWYKPKGAG